MSDSRPRERSRVQQVTHEEMEGIRRREYWDMRREAPRREVAAQTLVRKESLQGNDGGEDEDDYREERYASRRHRGSPDCGPDDMTLDRYRRPASPQPRDRRRYSSDDREEDTYRRPRSSHRERPRRAGRSMVALEREIENEFHDDRKVALAHKDDGYLWHSMKRRDEGNFFQRHFDSSYDGIIAGVAGAAIGSITAARFGGQQHKTAKAVGGALLGALAFNAAESHWRLWTEIADGVKETRDDAKEGLKDVAEKAKRFVPNP